MDNSSIIDEKLDTIVRTEPFRMKSQSSTKKKDESLLKYETYEK